VVELKRGQARLETDVSELKQGQARLEDKFDRLEDKFDRLEGRFDRLEALVRKGFGLDSQN
jgi:predicted nuclease with TOPRIM domain